MQGCTLISFATPDSFYPASAQALRDTLERLGWKDWLIEEVPSLGSYRKNNAFKAEFILRHLRRLRGPVIWFDVDGTFLRVPRIRDIHWNFDVGLVDNPRPDGEIPFSAGLIVFNWTPRAVEFLEKLGKLACSDLSCSEHRHMVSLRKELRGRVRFRNLTPYFRGTWAMNTTHPDKPEYVS
jgi:hypothetical protein